MHEHLSVVSTFRVRSLPAPAPDAAASPPWDEVSNALRYRAGGTQPDAVEFVLGSTFSPAHPLLLEFGEGLFEPGAEFGPHQLFAGSGAQDRFDPLAHRGFEIGIAEPAAFVRHRQERPAQRRAELRPAIGGEHRA